MCLCSRKIAPNSKKKKKFYDGECTEGRCELIGQTRAVLANTAESGVLIGAECEKCQGKLRYV